MRHRSPQKWTLIFFLIAVVGTAIYGANYLSFISYKPLHWKAYITLNYDALLATYGSVLRRIDLKSNPPPGESLPEVRLMVEPSSLKAMVSDLPDSAKAQYYKARLIYPDGKWRKVKYRLRGRNIWHWHEQKPSLRIKTKKDNPISLHRHLNLISPEDVLMIGNPFGEELARKFGVMAPNTQMVRLYLNKRYQGVYQLTNREDESFVRFNKRFPGPLYVGNFLQKEWAAEDFELESDLDVLELSNPMKEVTDLLALQPTPERFEALWQLVDKDKMAGWAALMAVISGTHSDYKHNQVFYLDPTRGKIEPVVSDILALGVILYPEQKERLFNKWKPITTISINERITPILAMAMADPTFVHLKNKKIYEALTSFASPEAQIELLESMAGEIENALFADPYKAALQRTFASWYRVPYSNTQYRSEKKRIREFIKQRSAFVMDELKKSKVALYSKQDGEFTVEVTGHSAILFKSEGLEGLQVKDAEGNFNSVKQDLTLYPQLYRASPENLPTPVSGRRSPEYTLEPGPVQYHFVSSPELWEKIKNDSDSLFSNAVTGDKVEVSDQSFTPREEEQHVVSLPLQDKPGTVKTLGPGRVTIINDMLVREDTSLVIKAGTQILLGPQVSIISRGKTYVEGTEAEPVLIRRLKPEEPWGVFAIIGQDSAGSRVQHLDARGGSSEFRQHVNFSGMVSIHHSDDFQMKNVTLSNNTIGDDTLRIISSDVDVQDIEVHSCLSDCIDFDFVTGTAKNIKIRDAGNDGFDFMSSNVSVEGYQVYNCGDKGISLGELSVIEGKDISVSYCDMGVAAKDKSLGTFENLSITHSRIGVASYSKNWRYGGAGMVKGDIRLSDNKIDREGPSKKDRSEDAGIYPVSFW